MFSWEIFRFAYFFLSCLIEGEIFIFLHLRKRHIHIKFMTFPTRRIVSATRGTCTFCNPINILCRCCLPFSARKAWINMLFLWGFESEYSQIYRIRTEMNAKWMFTLSVNPPNCISCDSTPDHYQEPFCAHWSFACEPDGRKMEIV